jgi:ABC-type nickel/cobalt efflux system permease component RcnA
MGPTSGRRRRPTGILGLVLVVASLLPSSAWSHDIPNQRVDRSIQIDLAPHRLQIDYEVCLTELTLVQDLRALMGSLPALEGAGWLDLYGRVTGPLNAKGLLVSLDDKPAELRPRGFAVVVEEHPRFTFHFDLPLPDRGKLAIRDTNFASSEGTSRLAVRCRDVAVTSDAPLATDVSQIPIQPVWQLSDEEERRTKEVFVDFRLADGRHTASLGRPATAYDGQRSLDDTISVSGRAQSAAIATPRRPHLSRLLDSSQKLPWVVLAGLALGLGAVHALQPGHGKTLVTAVAIGPGVRLYQPVILGLATTMAHTGSVLLVAALLWYSGTSNVLPLHLVLARGAGLAIAIAGFWRLGRQLGGYLEHDSGQPAAGAMSVPGLVGLGLAGGLVPCWDAVALIVLATALGRLSAGIGLVMAFSAGMGAVLLVVASLAWKARSAAFGIGFTTRWQSALGLASASILAGIGLYLFYA